MPAPCADASITRKAALPELPGWRCATPRLVGDPGALDSGLRAGSCAAWLIFAVTHRRETKPLRRPPGFAQPESRGAGILPSFVSGGRSAPPRLADRQPAPGSSSGSASQPLPSFPLPLPPPPPPPTPAPGRAGTHSLPWCHPVEICHARRLERPVRTRPRSSGGGRASQRRTGSPPAPIAGLEDSNGCGGRDVLPKGGSQGVCSGMGAEPRTKRACVAAKTPISGLDWPQMLRASESFLISHQLWCPSSLRDTCVAARVTTRTPETPEPQPQWESLRCLASGSLVRNS